jgi:hypothetical protein
MNHLINCLHRAIRKRQANFSVARKSTEALLDMDAGTEAAICLMYTVMGIELESDSVIRTAVIPRLLR